MKKAEGTGFEPATDYSASDFESAENPASIGEHGSSVPEDVPAVQSDPALVTVCEAWPTLPLAVRAGILAMVEASRGAMER